MLKFEEITAILPHRYPFLLVDRVLELGPGKYCKALKNVSGSEPYFQGHFPGNPLMPGVLVVEALAQAGGIAIFSELDDPKNSNILFGGIEKARFKHPVIPGDQLILDVKLKAHRGALWAFDGIATVEDKLAAKAEIKMMIFDGALKDKK